MALFSFRNASMLGASFVLAPERYDSRRSIASDREAITVGDLVASSRKTIQASEQAARCLILDTSDAREGIVIGRKQPTNEIGSAKKSFQAGDVIISRLRPYLRQVAWIDSALPNADDAALLCSTEFFVLRSVDRRSIAFLVPFLLSSPIQSVLAASQEGGHHPRFSESALLTLPIPAKLLSQRDAISKAVENAIVQYRYSESAIEASIALNNDALLQTD